MQSFLDELNGVDWAFIAFLIPAVALGSYFGRRRRKQR
jgi:uncharacterized membrane protein YfcA